MMIKNNKKLLFLCLLVILIATAYISFVTGTIKLSFNDLITKFTTGSNEAVDSIIDLRLPRILIALMVGAMLAVSGALLQAALQNPLAEANIIGVSSGALIMRALCMLFIPQLYFYLPLLSFIGGLIPFLIIILLHSKFRFNAVSMILVGLILTLLLSPKLNLLNLDDVQARSIGFNIDRYRWLTGLLAVFLASATVAIVGQLAFLGIIVPHVVRKLIGGNYRVLIPFSTVIGAWLLLVADLLGRVIQPPLEIPANAILMIVGGPMLIYLICQSQRNRI